MARPAVSRPTTVCAGCGAKNHAGWHTCQRCRRELPAGDALVVEKPAPRRSWIGAAGAVAVVLLAVAFTLSWPQQTEQSSSSPTGPPGGQADAGLEMAGRGAGSAAPGETVLTPVTSQDFARAGSAAYAHGQTSVALSAFEESAEAFPDDPDSRNNLGQVLVRLGRVVEAIPHLEFAAAADPDRWTFRFNLARARSQTGDWPGAVADYQLASQLFPDDHVTLYNLGRAQQKLGDHAGAAASLERAIALAPSEPSFLLSLAYSYEQLSRLPQALDAYRGYLEKAPQSSEAPTIRARVANLQRVGAPATDAEPAALPPPGE